MKSIKSLVGALVLALVIFSCEKAADTADMQQKKASFVMDDLTNTVWQSDCDKPYEITLFNIVDLGGGKYQWQWGIANLSGTSDLTRISFPIPSCVKYEQPKVAFQSVNGGLQQPAEILANDQTYVRCLSNGAVAPNVLSFLVPTKGTETTYFILTLNTNQFAQVTGYFQNANGQCGTTCFPGIKDECNVVSCSFSQGRYFASPHKWPAATVTVGGKTYTEAEGRALWNLKGQAASTSDALKAFFQATAIKLSAATISSTASVLADVKIIEDWLATQPKLTSISIVSIPKNKAVAEAAGRIGNWIDANHCK